MVKKVELVCVQCGEQFLREFGEVNRTRKPKTGPFCSRGCRNSYHCKGKPLSESRKAKMRGRTPWNKGKPHSAETCRKISEKAKLRTGEKNPNWKGGRYVRQDGYIQTRVNGKYKMEHVHLMEQHLGRQISRSEVVHHKNGDRQDNRLENLEVMTLSEHMRLHHPNGIDQHLRERTCVICGAKFMGRHNAKLCSDMCRQQRQREYWKRHDAKRRGTIAKSAAN